MGFREGSSTLDACEEVSKCAKFANEGSWGRKDYCALVTLDVENAVNSLPWQKIVEALERRRISAPLVSLR
jgi:hypothetical protein